MADISGNTWRQSDIVECEFADSGVQLQEKRERLANATGCTEDGDLGGLQEEDVSHWAVHNMQWLAG